VQVKVLDIDRDRQRISLGLKQTQSDPWQQVIEKYHEDDVVEGRVTKVVTFGAFVEILPGVEGLVHISELAQHHVENPREIVAQGQPVNVKIIEVDGERRRLSLSLKRVEETDEVQPRADGGESVHTAPRPTIDLSEEVFAEAPEPQGDEAALESSYELSAAADEAASPAEAVVADDAVAEEAPLDEAPLEDGATEEIAAEDVATEDAAEPAADEADAAPASEPEASASEE
jgi:small subunit ribosomal protein S1